jgi:hypothetical protein
MVSYGTELLALLVTAWYFMRRRSPVSLLLLLLLIVIAATETLGKFRDVFSPHLNIFLLQNIELLLEIGTYLGIYYLAVSAPALRRLIGWLLSIYLAFSVFAALRLQPLDRVFPTLSIVTGGLFILASILIYFYQELRNMEQSNLYRDPLFYISVGLFVFYANEIPVMTLLNYYLEHHIAAPKVYFVFNLKLVVSIAYYLLYSSAIIWTTRKSYS